MSEEDLNQDETPIEKEHDTTLHKVCSSVSWTEFPSKLEEEYLDVSGPIQRKAATLRSQEPVGWLPYLKAGLMRQRDYNFITSYQLAKTKEQRDDVVRNFSDEGFNELVSSVQNVCIVEEIQKFLVLIDDMLWEDSLRIYYFNPEETEPWKAFMELLSSSDEFVCNIASRIICKFIRMDGCTPSPSDLEMYLNWLKGGLRHDNKYLLAVARCLQRLLRFDEYRVVFFNLNGIYRISRLLCIVNKPQEHYQLVYCLWVASFNTEIAEKMNRFSIVPIIIEILEGAPAEVLKLPRVIMATIRNLLVKPRDEGMRKHNALLLIQCKIARCLQIIKSRGKTISDPEFNEDCEVIDTILSNYIEELSTFDEYLLEVRSGRLEWSVVHTSKPFWQECADRLNDNDYELLKILVSLLATSRDSVILCVASHDLGEYMTYYQRGRQVVQKLGGKEALLELLSNKHPVVKYHALKSLQILMLNNFDLLNDYVSNQSTFDIFKTWNN